MSYAMLLEDYVDEAEAREITYASLAESMTSIIEFVNNDVTLDISLNLEAADDEAATKDAVDKAKDNVFKKFAAKLKEWAVKFKEMLIKFIKKASVAIATGGTKVAKALTKKGAKTKKTVKLKELTFKEGQISAIATKILAIAANVNAAALNGKVADERVLKQVEDLEDEWSGDHNGMYKDEQTVDPGADSAQLFKTYVDPYLDGVGKKINEVEKTCKSAISAAEKLASELSTNKAENHTNRTINNFTNRSVNAIMKVNSHVLNFAFKAITVAVGNSVKISVACGALASDRAAEKEAKKEDEKVGKSVDAQAR